MILKQIPIFEIFNEFIKWKNEIRYHLALVLDIICVVQINILWRAIWRIQI